MKTPAKHHHPIPGLLALLFAAWGVTASAAPSVATTEARIESESLVVTLDPAFPRIVQYLHKATGATWDGQRDPVSAVELNGKLEPCQVSFRQTSASDGEYLLTFPEPAVELTLRVTVQADSVELRATGIRERGAVKVMNFAFPGNALLSLSTRIPDAAIAAVHATCRNDRHQGEFRERVGPLASIDPAADVGNYFFASAGPLAAGIAANNPVDIQRTAWCISETGGVKTCTASCPNWMHRELETETVDLPVVRVFVTGDRNGDGQATWQDAALAYRAHMPKPFGHEFVRTTVGENIAMNFASGAQQPFLRILDNVKKAYLATDGLGQQVVIKGFSSEGHDSANTDYGGHHNERAGGLKDFTVLLERAREYNARIGIHINASEVYPEARRYKPEILQRDGNGNPKGGWTWLDHAHMIDKRKDLLTGQLFASLEQMRRELPRLDFVYVDTFWENGWPAWKIANKLKDLGLPMYTEGDLPLDPWTTWAHWRGSGSVVERFLWYSDRDLFNNDALLRGGRGDDDGFLGWQNQHSFHNFIRCTFARHLPTKYLKHFDLLRWEPGKEAVFSEGVKAVKTGEAVAVTQNGRIIMTWTGAGAQARLFVPWDPKSEAKIYVWDETGTEATWELPPRWKSRKSVWLYRLTDMGRTEETQLPVVDGKVTIQVGKSSPYVVYAEQAKAQQPLTWGEGSPVKDPGFDSHGFADWEPSSSAGETGSLRVENDARGNARLVIAGTNGVEGGVSQLLYGLKGGATHVASVWVQVNGWRLATITVQPQAPGMAAVSNYVEKTEVRHSAPNDPRSGSRYQRMKVWFTLPAGCDKALLTLKAGRGGPSSEVEFDDVRVMETRVPPESSRHWFWEDFENVDMGYGPFTGCPGERTHLSEANPPHTSDTINGQFSLKSRDGGRVLRTLPCTIRFKPHTRYQVACETMGDGHLTAESGGRTALNLKFPGGRGRIAGEFATGKDAETFLALYRDGGDFIVIDDLAIEELGPAPAVAPEAPIDDRLPGRSVLLEEHFTERLSADWRTIVSPHPGTTVESLDGAMSIAAAANVSALAERAIPSGATAVECRLINEGDEGQTWGPGLCVLWPGGQQLRINLRGPDGCFGVDSTAAGQIKAGRLAADRSVALRIRLDADRVVAEARNDAGEWQGVAAFPRAKFPGEPLRIRLGKMHAVEGTDDHSAPGSDGACSFTALRVYGK